MTVDHPQWGTMCEICFRGLTPELCAEDQAGQKWDICKGLCAIEAGIDQKPSTPMTFAIADRIADVAHDGQPYGGGPYIEHPRAVAALVREAGGDDETVIAAVLHDTVEDARITLELLRAWGCTERTVSGVDSVSKRDDETYMDMVRRAAADEVGLPVKRADNTHNSSTLADQDSEWARRQEKKYAKARTVLFA